MNDPLLSALVAGAATVGCLHTLAPDHWMPFAALGRANRWPAGRVVRTTMLCGLGHVTVSAILSLIAGYAGLQVLERMGSRLAEQATFLLIIFGALYLMWDSGEASPAILIATGTVPSRRDPCSSSSASTSASP